MHNPVLTVAILTRPTLVNLLTRRPPIAAQSFTQDARFSQWRWRDAVFEGPFGRSQDGPSLRSQAATGLCGVSSAGAASSHPLPAPILVCAFGEQERPTALVARSLVWSSRSSEQNRHRLEYQRCGVRPAQAGIQRIARGDYSHNLPRNSSAGSFSTIACSRTSYRSCGARWLSHRSAS